MALRITPPGEDSLRGTRGIPVSISQPGTPPGEDGELRASELENSASDYAQNPPELRDDSAKSSINFLRLVRIAEQQAQLYTAQVNRRAWSQSYRAFHNEHYVGSKYTKPDYRSRSRLFVPKTRTAVRKDLASVAASLFNNIDAINCLPGNEGDPKQRAAAAVMEELVNYRTDRVSGKASFPWFLVSMGCRQDATVTGICISKQAWKQEYRKTGEQPLQVVGDDTETTTTTREVWTLDVDRPDMVGFPPENVVIHPGADWTNPIQSSAYLILKYPMTLDEIQSKQNAPVNPWLPVSEAELRTAGNAGKQDMEAIRRARESGLDRFDETQTGTDFAVVWVYETFIRTGGEDWTFFSVGDKYYLTDPKPTREVYPEQFGERPCAMGYGALEAHRIFPMSPVESWQPLQIETNDLRNLQLDAVKQNVMPISKVVRGKRIDMDQIKRRSSGSSIFVDNPTDVTWETPPQMGQAPMMMSQELGLELDDLSGQQNFGSVQDNNALGKTLGGLKLASGAANAVQEFDIRVWIETWATPALAQIVRLEQYYESDPKVLGLCGQRAQLFEKYGVNKIDDELLEQEITIRVSVGLGAGDPQQRLAKFQSAITIVEPLLVGSPKFQSGQMEINDEAIIEEVFGAAGYKDGGSRFFTVNPGPRPNPMGDLQTQKLQSEITKNAQTGKGALLTGIANVGKVAIGKRELESNLVDMLLGHQGDAQTRGFLHGHQTNQTKLSAMDHGHRHGMAIVGHKRQLTQDALNAQQQQQEQAGGGVEQEGAAPGASPAAGAPSTGPSGQTSTPPPPSPPGQGGAPMPHDMMMQLLQRGHLQLHHDPQTGHIHVTLPQQ
jgi:hypothetical protein